MKQTSTKSGGTFNKYLILILSFLSFSFSQSVIANSDNGFTCNGGRVTNLYFNELNGGADLPITNGSIFTVAQLGSLYNLEAGTSGTIGSIKYTITGPTPTSNIENATPYNSPGTGSGAWTGAVGTYNVNLKTYSGADATGTLCHDTTITFVLSNTNFNCNCTGNNLVLNPGFENGTTNWSWSGGTLAQGTGAVACGSFSGDLNNTSTSSKAWQLIGTNLVTGTVINASVYAGTHDNTFNNWVAVEFLDAANIVLGTSVYIQVDKILANSPAGPQLYTFSATVPANAIYTRVAFGGTGSYTKTDRWCVTTSSPQPPVTGERCFVSPTIPGIVWAKSTWTTNPANQNVTIRTTFSKTFVDNTYGTNAIGWPGGHTFGNLTGSDKLGWSIKDANGVVKLAFEQDYISSSASFPSGYGTLGFGGDGGNPTVGAATDVTAFLTSIDKNLNQNGASYYSVITNSPATDNNYTPNPTYPNWVYDVWYEVTVKLSAFGAAGFGYPDIATVHASPSKTGNNTEVVNPTGCIGSIGDFVWSDNNGNGIQDAGENGIQGVTVILTKPDATTVTTVTNASGFYQFTNLSAGTYTVSFPPTIAGGFGLTTANAGTDNTKDSDPAQGTGIASGVVLYPGQNNTTVDAGYVLSNLTLGNKVFFDLNRSGMYEATDSVASGIIVRLYADANNDNIPDGALIQAMTTNALGEYSFTNLAPGNYIVGAVIPPAHAITVINGGDPDNNIDNDNNAINNVSGEARGNSISLASGTEPTAGNTNNTYDIGFYNPTLPPNGGQNCFAGTNPVVFAKSFWTVNANSQTVTLRVTFSKGFVDNTYGTNAIGWPGGHTFGNLTGSDHLQWSIRDANGVEKLAFKQDYISASAAFQSGYGCLGFGGDGGTPTAGLASDVLSFRTSIATNFNDYGYVLTTNSPATDTNYTANPAQPNWIYDVWYEVTVKASVFGAPGFGFVNVASVHASPSKTGNNTEIITNTPCVSSIGDRVWYDTDRDGIQDAGENGIRGVTVKLRNAANVVIATQVTNTSGNYLFTGLNPGTYTVEFPATVYGYVLSPAYVGTNRNIDSDPSVTTGITPSIVLGTADDNRTIDAGYAPDCACVNSTSNLLINPSFENGTTGWSWSGGTLTTGTGFIACGAANGFNNWSSGTSKVWQDVNVIAGSTVSFSAFAGTHAPGIACSPKLSLVFLNSANATISQTDVTVTRIVGDYNDQIEQYSITAVAPAGTVKVRVQSTITCNTMKLDAFCLTAIAPGSIGDRVWKDTDADGVQDANEVGVAGVTVVLLNAAGQPIATTTTDAFGNYKFSGLPAGDYSVRITPPANYSLSAKGLGGDPNLDSDFDPITYTTSPITLLGGQNRTDIDAGLKFTQPQPASVGDRVWLDTNGDGIQDAGEPGISNVLVTLYNSVGSPVRSTYTDVNGNYLFTDVTPGTYSVGVSLPPAFVFSPNTGAISGTTNSDIVPATGRTVTFTVNAGDQITYVDAGLKQQQSANGSVGDYVWNDINKNGIQDAGEPGIAGVTVRLVNATTNAIIATTTTDAAGNYIFNDVPAGNYLVDFVTPAGYTTTTKLNSNVAASGTDSDVDPATSRTATFTLAAGQRITTVDAGYWLTTAPGTGKIGDRVWLDANQNGIQDAGEANVQGVTVTLYDAANTAIKMAVTDANGNYLFTDLAAGNYTVGFSNIPQGFTFTTQGLGTAATGSDANPATGRTATIALAAGQTNLDVDAGIRSMMAGTASIGNRVWNDLNNNGIQDAGEPGIQGITVELLDGNGNPIDSDPATAGVQPTTRVTNALGEYLFTGLPAGDYRVRFSNLPAGFNASPKAAGTDRTIDSDGNAIAAGTSTTDVISVASGEERLDIDFGLNNPTAPLGQIGDYVWFDSNNNGVQDATEQGVPGVTVSLLNASNTVIATTVTDANGNYRFVNLADATYSVKFSNLPAGFVFSPKDLGGNDNLDSDADPVTGQTGTYTIAAGNTNITVDAGIYSTRAALGDYVWFDANSNGIQEGTEKGIAGITVTLYDAANVAVTSAITDQNGRYFFSNLNPGTYTVGFGTIPSKLAFTLRDVVAAGDAADSDVDPATGKTGAYTLVAGQVNLTVDAGLKPLIPATVGDFVWYDDNGNGLQDPGEMGVPGIIVTLYNAANQPIGSAVTDGNGFYQISNVPPGTGYYVKFSNKPDPTTPWTLQNVGGAGANNNSKADATGQSAPFNVAEGQNITNMDAGLVRLGSIGDRVFNDLDGDGIQDANEVGVAGITITLLNAAGQPIATTTTDAFGNYKFSGLAAGNYSVRVTPPSNYSLSPKGQGGDGNLDSDFDPITYTTSPITLLGGQNRTDIDAGLKFTQPQPASVGDRVWLDINGDGVQDAGEPGVSNVLVTLYNSVGAPVRFTYTDVNGNYLFTDVTPGTYTVGVSLSPAFVFSPNNGAISGAANSDIIPATGRTASFTVNAGDQITYVDAGLKKQVSTNGSVGDFVWNDINQNGIQEAGEPGIVGVTVRLVNATTNAIIATTTTDAAGNYIFNDVPAGNYLVDFVTPAGYTTTTKLNSNVAASGTDSDVDPATSRTATFALAAGQRITTVDAGYWLTTPPGTAKLGDRVWLDANQNGVQDAGEANVQGVTVTLYDAANTAIKITVTDSAGKYLFTDLAAGNYTVGFSNIPQGYTFTTQGLGTAATGSDANPATGRTGTITLAAGQTNLDVDAGIRSMMAGTASIGNRVWSDLNNNGLQDATEPGIQGVTVELLDGNGNSIDSDPATAGVQPTTRVTNALGEYLFTGLPAGDYKVRFSNLPAGYNASPKAAGTNRDIDSDGNAIAAGTSTTDVVSVASGEERLDIDFGLFNPTAPAGQIGDFVWFDSNNNGVQDATEQGVPGVTVSLLNASNTVIATTVTDANGNYRFVGLADATYSVKFSNLPAGFTFSPKDLGGNDNTDSDADPTTGITGTYTITGGNTNITVDAGIYSTRAALGDYVWFDANSNGIQDATEKGIAGITVTLYDAANVAVTSAITDQNGRYFFNNLNPGTYTVGFGTIPSKLAFTLRDVVAAGDAADSDVDPATGKTGAYTLVAGQVNLTVDAGLKPVIPASIGDFVWYDTDRDGIQDAGEPGVSGVIVTLYNSANQPIGSAITDGNGYYLISNVPPGTGYYVVFSNKPADLTTVWTLQNVGGVTASDNSKADAVGQTLTFDVASGQNITNMDAGFHNTCTAIIKGNVWNDADGMTDGYVDSVSVGPKASIPNNLRASLIDLNTGMVVKNTLVSGLGVFQFNNIAPGGYYILISSINGIVGQFAQNTVLPTGWKYTGEILGTGPGRDIQVNGKLNVTMGYECIINANFGIQFDNSGIGID